MKALVLVMIAVMACGGPGAGEVLKAKSAQYSSQPATLYDIAFQVAQQDYKIGATDPASGMFETKPQMYSPEGGRQSAGAGDMVQYTDRSILLSLVVEIVKTERGHAVVVTPRSFQMVAGSPQPRELKPDDPSLPGWVTGRVDALAVAIYDAAKPNAIQ